MRILEDLPQGWNVHALPDVLYFQEGPGVRNWQFTEHGVKLLNVRNINNGKINLDATSVYISSEEAYGKYAHFLADAGDLVIASSGIVVDNFHNKIAFVKEEHLPLCMNTSTIRFKVQDHSLLDINFFKLFLGTNGFKSQLKKLITGSAQLNFGPSHLKKIKIPLPPLNDQKRIAHLLSKVEGLIAQRKQHLQQLDDLLKSVFLEMFGDPVKNERGWETKTLGAISEVQGGLQVTTKRKDNPIEVPYLRVANVYRDRLDLSEIKFIRVTNAELERVRLKKGDLLIVEGHGNPDEIGRSAVWDGSVDDCVHQNHLIRVRVDTTEITEIYASAYINSTGGRIQMFRAGKTTSGLNTISSKNVKETNIPVPPFALQEQFSKIVEKVECTKNYYQKSLYDLEHFYGVLSQKAFKGELDLSRVKIELIAQVEETTFVPISNIGIPQWGNSPYQENLKLKLSTSSGRKEIIQQWLTDYINKLGENEFVVTDFIDSIRATVAELLPDNMLEFGPSEYDFVKGMTFDALKSGRLEQSYDDPANRVQLKFAKG